MLRIAFEETNSLDPVIANMILEFKQPVSILQSDISSIHGNSKGQMLIQLPKDEEIANKMIEYLNKKDSVVVQEVD